MMRFKIGNWTSYSDFEEKKLEVRRKIQETIHDEIETESDQIQKIDFHTTSIYDHTIFEAFSRIV